MQKGTISYTHCLLIECWFGYSGRRERICQKRKTFAKFSDFLLRHFSSSLLKSLLFLQVALRRGRMSYQHPLASLSAAAAAALPIQVPSRSNSTSSPAQHQQQSSGNHQQTASQYYNHHNHAAPGGGAATSQVGSSGQGGIVHSPDSIDSPRSVPETKKGRKRKASHGTGAGGSKEDEKDAAAKKRQVVSCGECKVSLHCPLEL